ncbi:helix-turn-helix transcriptional regulator [Streptomyces mirabilis]|uniref:helix-turn-helix transcriptional regulator n=1 Tax=Streptomyces mirabilis TaxID=68239 RepID=UPI0036908FB7
MPTRSLPLPSAAPAPAGAARAAFLNVKDAAEYLGLSPHTLYVWRHRRQGPPSFRMGPRGRVMYRREALDAWIREQGAGRLPLQRCPEPAERHSSATAQPYPQRLTLPRLRAPFPLRQGGSPGRLHRRSLDQEEGPDIREEGKNRSLRQGEAVQGRRYTRSPGSLLRHAGGRQGVASSSSH